MVFFKQKTAYEMRISDWSSDVCSSDLALAQGHPAERRLHAEGICGGGSKGGLRHGRGAGLQGHGDRPPAWRVRGRRLHSRRRRDQGDGGHRSEKRREGTECVSTRRSRWLTDKSKTHNTIKKHNS